MKIDIKLVKMRNQKPLEVKECYIELRLSTLYYKHDFIASEPINPDDPELGWEEVHNYVESETDKESIIVIEMFRTDNQHGKLWGVFIAGADATIKLYFKNQDAAQTLRTLLCDWKFNRMEGPHRPSTIDLYDQRPQKQ